MFYKVAVDQPTAFTKQQGAVTIESPSNVLSKRAHLMHRINRTASVVYYKVDGHSILHHRRAFHLVLRLQLARPHEL